ncbi:SDR family NAD(P)-dependent oxidoreductase [Rhizobium tumorigenes]|uniref:SDR family NAD(P)-dependent oxidoreductase n=1 Tax=Rhizobium tumorigenes TaxID=2041385 RepID=A0AAF1KTV7_9HYPH|nr:SDR family NAD(P)-dependent oxidoreductase [Rhizobium tumorigenes]WFR97705.1 SDR family NAD(P)-dependent oxidoreductase [Rhizobium tumorigenes]
MRRIFITGSSDGLGLAAASSLLEQGHAVVLHARTKERASALGSIASRALAVVIGDLASAVETCKLADQVNAIGRMDAVIHNAGVYAEPQRGNTPEGHARTLAVNTLAPYILTALMDRPDRLVYLSSGLHQGGGGSLADIDWTARPWSPAQAYAETKLQIAALAAAIGRHWPQVFSNSVDPGWVSTKMGGAGAPGTLATGQETQSWLAASDDPSAKVSGFYWHHRQQRQPCAEVTDIAFQDQLVAKLEDLTGVSLFG